MPYRTDINVAWPRPSAGQETIITWSHADFDAVDKSLLFGGSGAYVSPQGSKLFFTVYPDFTATIVDAGQRDIVRNAFAAWDLNSGVKFVEVADSVNADIRVGLFGTGSGLVNSGETAFGTYAMWKGSDFHKVAIEINPNALVSPDRLYNTVLHEIGHALGLDDTAGLFVSSQPDVMNPTALSTRLSADDIAGIQSLYGGQPPAPEYVRQVARLYEAGLDRKFDVEGLNLWIDQREAGLALTTMASQFLDSPEFIQRFGDERSMSASAFTTRMYLNVLDRTPDASGLSFWESAMSSGMSHAQMLVAFADSAENLAHSAYLTGLKQVQPGYWDLAT